MLFPHRSHARHDEKIRITPEIIDHEIREFWRECALFSINLPMNFRGERNRRIS
jgi:hypothetical protein